MALLAFLVIFSLSTTISPATAQEDVYIVHVKKPDSSVSMQSEQALRTWYHSFLPSDVTESENRLIYSYKNVASGFAARLTAEEVEAMSHKDGFLYAHKQRILSLHTTHTPNFLGLHQNMGFLKGSNFGKGVIVGVLDTGIWPTHPSFSDHGMSPPPAKWKGKCDFDAGICNNKLIGARNFIRRSTGDEPSDEEGHGTHTASTAVGGFVKGAEALGNAKGTAVGMAPSAHLAIYKVCSEAGCADSDILAAMDAAVEDGVDVLSLSLGGGSLPFYEDVTALGGFGAIQKGVFVSCSAGNNGPEYQSLSNEAPWILTVGASTVDRRIRVTAKLGDGAEYAGESLFQPKNFSSKSLPLIYAGKNNKTTAFCGPRSLNSLDVRGKVVLCDRGEVARIDKGKEVKRAGGAAMILANDVSSSFTTIADAHVLPATNLDYESGLKIKAYINSTSTPTATILFRGTIIGDSSAPAVASFSSRGPSVESPGILKPDIIGPGVSIIAAWPFSLADNITIVSNSTFNVLSGTSMSCPHLTGIAALLKSSHPDWSPAAIKSAIMTTADAHNLGGDEIADQTNHTADIFATGAGHVNPSKANDPGLVYETEPEEYIPYLCGLNYSDTHVSVIVHKTVTCANVVKIGEAQLNYPTFSVQLLGGGNRTYTRTVTNVGPANSSYVVDVKAPVGVDVSVVPSAINFTAVGEKAMYTVTFAATNPPEKFFSQGFLRWVSDQHSVYSSITVIFEKLKN